MKKKFTPEQQKIITDIVAGALHGLKHGTAFEEVLRVARLRINALPTAQKPLMPDLYKIEELPVQESTPPTEPTEPETALTPTYFVDKTK